MWKNYICNVSASGICTTPGRVTPNIYNQLTASLNVSYGLYEYGPFLVDFMDSTYLKDLFSGISKDCCPSMQKSTKWMYTGFAVVSVAVMLSLILWIVFSQERRHRKYTKKHMAWPQGMKGPYMKPYAWYLTRTCICHVCISHLCNPGMVKFCLLKIDVGTWKVLL